MFLCMGWHSMLSKPHRPEIVGAPAGHGYVLLVPYHIKLHVTSTVALALASQHGTVLPLQEGTLFNKARYYRGSRR